MRSLSPLLNTRHTTRFVRAWFALSILLVGPLMAQPNLPNIDLGGRMLAALRPDYHRPLVYALTTGGATNGQVLALDPVSRRVVNTVTVGKNPTDMDVAPEGDVLFVLNYGDGTVSRVDLTSFAVNRTLTLPNTGDHPAGLHHHVLATGVPNRIIFVDAQWAPVGHLLNFNTGEELATLTAGGGYGIGGLARGPNGAKLYVWGQYGWSAGLANSLISRLNLGTGLPVLEQDSPNDLPRGPMDEPIFVTANGDVVFCKTRSVKANDLTSIRAEFPENLYGITLHGEVVFGTAKAYNGKTGGFLASLPVSSTIQAVSGDQKNLLMFDPVSRKVVLVALDQLAGISGPASQPTPADAATISLPLDRLAWTADPRALRYRVYLGSSAAAVAAAGTNSLEFLGETDAREWPLATALREGTEYFWRVDVVSFSATSPGPTWRFLTSPVTALPGRFVVKSVAGSSPLPVQLLITNSAGGNWALTSSVSWLSVSATSGEIPAAISVQFDTAKLPVGTHVGELVLTSAETTLRIPVFLEVIKMAVTKMLADPNRPYIYALQPGAGNPDRSFVLFINTDSGQIDRVLPVGFNPVDLTINQGEGRLYVADWGKEQTPVIDLATQTLLPPLKLTWDAYKINAGAPGRIYVEGFDQWIEVGIYDTTTGAKLGTLPWPQRAGDGEVDPTGRYYYHSDDNISNAAIHKYSLAGDTPVDLGYSLQHPYGSRNLILSADGSRLFWRGYVYDQDLQELGGLNAEIYATTLRGEIAFSENQAFNSANGALLTTFPFPTTVMAVSADQKKLFRYNPVESRLVVVPMDSFASVPGPGTQPTPADSSVVSLPIAELKWSTVPSAVRYEVYFGTNSEAVASAVTGSPLQLGTVDKGAIALTSPLLRNTAYFWRIDTVGFFGTTKGPVWRFDIAPIEVSPNTVRLSWIVGGPLAKTELQLGTSAEQSWELLEDSSWLELDQTSGQGPATVRVTLDPAGKAAGTYTTNLRLRSGNTILDLPVEFKLISLSLSRLVADLHRPYLYGLHPGSGQFEDAFVVFFNATSGEITRVIPAGSNPTDFSINGPEGLLYISNWNRTFTRVVNLDTQMETVPLALGTDVYRINAGRSGRIYTEGLDQWVNLTAINTFNGAVVATINVREGDGEVSPDGYFYYHCDNNISDAHISKFDLRNDGFQLLASSAQHPYGSRNLLMSGDGSRLFWRGFVFNQDLQELGNLNSEVYATTLRGELAFSENQALNTLNGAVLTSFPFASTVVAVSGDQKWLYRFHPIEKRLVRVSIDSFASVAGPGINPTPVDHAVVTLPVRNLKWSTVPAAVQYDVFLGTNQAAVAAAVAGGPLHLGSTDTGAMVLTAPLQRNTSYYWRVDAKGFFGTTVGPVWHFEVAPVEVSPTALQVVWVLGGRTTTAAFQIDTGPEVAWELLEDSPWLELEQTSGQGPKSVQLVLDPGGLSLGSHTTTLRVRAGSSVLEVPVEFKLITLSVSRMLADPERPFIYGLHPGSASFPDAYLVFIDTRSREVSRIIPIGTNPTDFAINQSEGLLYVSNWTQNSTRVVDLESQSEVAPLNLGTDVYRINAGRQGRVYWEGQDQWVAITAANTFNGATVSQVGIREGDGEVSPDGNFYFHCDNNISNAHISKFDVRADQFTLVASSTEHPYGSRNLVLSGNGSRLFWRGFVYSPDLIELRNLGSEIYASSRDGTIAFSDQAALDVSTGAELYRLPLTTSVMAMSGDDRTLFLFNPAAGSFLAIDRAGIANRPPQVQSLAFTTQEDAPISFSLVGTDPENDPLTFEITAPPALGQLTSAGQSQVYTPPTNYFGSVTFSFRARDAWRVSGVATVTINILPADDAPLALNDQFRVAPGWPRPLTLSGTDVEQARLAFRITKLPSHGKLSEPRPLSDVSQTVTYTPDPGYTGPDAFEFVTRDNAQDSAPAMITLVVEDPGCVASPEGLVSWFRAESNVVDQVGGNEPRAPVQVAFAPGTAGLAFRFSGPTDAFEIRPNPALDVGSKAGLTVEAWLKPDSLTTEQAVWSWSGPEGRSGLRLQVSNTGAPVVLLEGSTTAPVRLAAPTGLMLAGRWHHLVVTYDRASGQAVLYLDGLPAATQSLVPGLLLETRGALFLGGGAVAPTVPSFQGLVDEFAIYERALSPREVNQQYEAFGAGRCPLLLAPTITSAPLGETVQEGQSKVLAAGFLGTGPLTFQWQRNGDDLPNQTQSQLVFAKLRREDSGSYRVRISGPGGTVLSPPATLTVLTAPLLTNPGFETGDVYGWLVSKPTTALSPVVRGFGYYPGFSFFQSTPSEGRYALTHNFDASSPGAFRLSQEVELPAGAPALTFDYRLAWNMLSYPGSTLSRTFSVVVEPAGGGTALKRVLVQEALPRTLQFDTGPQSGIVDLAEFAGRSVRLVFEWQIPERQTGPGFAQLDNTRITVVEPPSFAPTVMEWRAGSLVIGFKGEPGRTYRVLVSNDLQTWEALGNATELSPGVLEMVDSGAAPRRQRFYRLAWP